jgi:hypothetical protein
VQPLARDAEGRREEHAYEGHEQDAGEQNERLDAESREESEQQAE